MKKAWRMVVAGMVAGLAGAVAAQGGMGILWENGGWMEEYGGGSGVAENHKVVWQLVFAGKDNVANAPDLSAANWLGGDDVLLAVREIPQGGGTAADGTSWNSLLEWDDGNTICEKLDWNTEGWVFQRIYQGTPSAEDGAYYYETGLMEIDTGYFPGSPPQEFRFDDSGEGVVVDRRIEPKPHEIASLADWEALAAFVAGGGSTAGVHYRQTADIEGVKTPVGGFAGVYEGNGKTLTVALAGTNDLLAPFSGINGAVIRNLTVAGKVSGGQHSAGLVGAAYGTNRIENCEVSAEIATSGNYCGGFVGHGTTSETVLSGCVFSGSLPEGKYSAAFWGWSDAAAVTLENCLDLGANAYPVGLGLNDGRVANTYYVQGGKQTGLSGHPWSQGGKQGFAVTGAEGVRVALEEGSAGVAHGGAVYAGQGETVALHLESDGGGAVFQASEGDLSLAGGVWRLAMPGKAVEISEGLEIDVQVRVPAGWTAIVSLPIYQTAKKFGDTPLATDLPQGTTVLFWDDAAQVWSGGMKNARGWQGVVANHSLAPGEGVCIRNPSGSDIELTVTGVMPKAATLGRDYAGGGKWSLVAHPYPAKVQFGDTELANVLPQRAQVRFWNSAAQAWGNPLAKTAKGWASEAAGHVLGVGEAFFIQSPNAGTWEAVKPESGKALTAVVAEGAAAERRLDGERAVTGGGMCVLWGSGGWMMAPGGEAPVAKDNEVVWQLIDAGADGRASAPALNGENWLGGDDVLLAVRVIPKGGGLADDGTTWDEQLLQTGGVAVYVDMTRQTDGKIYQRVYQGQPKEGGAYFQTGLFAFGATHTWEGDPPELFYFDGAGNGVVMDREVSEEPGSEANPIQIATLEDWEALAAYVAGGGETAGVHYKQTADIEGVKTPVGGFAGVYDGNGKTLAVALSGTDQCLAPFLGINGAVIRNLKVSGKVEGGTHCAGLAGAALGTNRIENCEVAAAVTTSGTHGGGFLGHGGTSETTLSGCVFSGSVSGTTASTTNLATFWGWSNDGAKPVLEKCLDASDCTAPIGLGFPNPGTAGVRNTYYLRGDKTTSTWRAWSYGGKQGFAVTGGDGVRVELAEGGAGLAYGGTVYAGEGETVRLRLGCDIDGATFVASAGSLAKDGDEWALAMPGKAVTIFGGVGVPYVDPTDGGKVKWCAVYEGAAGTTAWEDGKWYVAEGGPVVTGRIQVSGNVNLILKDGAKLVAQNGIRVNKGASLTIWGQVGGSGRLEATGGASWAGIGGEWYEGQETSENRHCGSVTVNGGVVVAQGGRYGAGIGGGDTGDGGTVTVNGGVVEATGQEGSAGIGGGDYGNGGEFLLTGGKVTARGSTRTSQKSGQASPGIGAGRPNPDGDDPKTSGKVTIRGGEVAAFAGVPGTNGNAHATAAQAIGVNVDDADYNEANNPGWLELKEVAVYTSENAAEPVAAAEREAACRATNVWVRACPHRLEGIVCAWCGATLPPPLPGKGTEAEPYLIGDYEMLVAFGMVVNGTHPKIGKNEYACGRLTNDIAATGTDWTPIGKGYHVYRGTFDGDGHTIRGLSNEGVAEAPFVVGLFGDVGGGTVRNVRLEGVSITIKGSGTAGGIAGSNSGTVSNCCVIGSVSGDEAGGVVGNNSGTVANCWASGRVSADMHEGGIAGFNGGVVTNCYAICEVPGFDSSGGVVGRNDKTVANSYCLAGAEVVGYNHTGGTISECGELTAEEFRDVGNFKGWDFGNVWWMGAERPLLRVFLRPVALTVESAYGTGVPAAGTNEVWSGEAVEARMEGSPVALGEGLRAACTGWTLEGGGTGGGTGTVARFTLTNAATLRWTWATQALVRVEAGAHGTATGGGWVAVGGTAVLRAEPESGHPFTGWEGDFGKSSANPLEVAVTGPGTARATFHTTYYAGADGDDGADGLGRESAVREIATALERAASGDTVVAGAGRYGAVEVPSGVTVKGEAGTEGTVIDGGGTRRCVEAAAGAVVEGAVLENGYAAGDGGGALLAEGASLKRCIVRGNQAGGAGGGAKGGVLENCLVVSNRAAAGGGAAGAVLRHCTVARNAGGGAKDCRTVNSVFWENDGDDAAGGLTEWSLCNPAAEGQGNIEGDPLFAGEGDWRLAFGSPCINAAGESETKVDLAGAPRPQPKVYGEAAAADMGCYEYVPKARFVWKEGRAVPPYESWADAARDIQSALDISGDGDRVVVEAGTYEEAVTMRQAVVLTGFRGAEETVIDGGGNWRPVTMQAGGVLEGFTVRNGFAENGGGIWIDGGAVVRNVTVNGCKANQNGGGVFATGGSVVQRCALTGNRTTQDGGGAYMEQGSRLLECAVSGNTAVSAGGGGVYGKDAEIAGCELSGNTAEGSGGGAKVNGGTFHNNLVSGNTSIFSGYGGGLYATSTFCHDCLVVGNQAQFVGGVYADGTSELWNFTVADNRAWHRHFEGVGVYLSGTSLLGNSVVWDNRNGIDSVDNVFIDVGATVRHSCSSTAMAGEGNIEGNPLFVGDGDYHLRAGSPCIDAGERQDWMLEAVDYFDGQRRVVPGNGSDGGDSRVDIGADEAAVDAYSGPTASDPAWTWRVVQDAHLQLQSTTNLLLPASWTDEGSQFVATNGVWKMPIPADGPGVKFRRLIWRKD